MSNTTLEQVLSQVLFSVQIIEEYAGYKMVVYGDKLSPSYSIFDSEGKEVEGNTLDMEIPSLQAWVEHNA